ncbi:MAG: hypothetical protein QXJ15_01870 [Candidatus Bathyarchaeia archaeon]
MLLGPVLFAIALLVGGLSYVYIKQGGALFLPSIDVSSFPEDQRHFFSMKGVKLLATARPSTTLSHLLREIHEGENSKVVSIDLISYDFSYKGYEPGNKWYEALKKVVEKRGKVRLLGGEPGEEREKDLKGLKELGAEVRILDSPPRAHLFLLSRKNGPDFIWSEGWHENDRAVCIAYTRSPSEDDVKMARDYFEERWERGRPL